MVSSDHHEPLDRRESARINWINSEVQVLIIPSNNDSKVMGLIQDISPGGFKVKAKIPEKVRELFFEWEEIDFETFGDFSQLKGQGRVSWRSPNADMIGIKFGRVEEESRKCLYGFFGRLSID